MLFRVFCETLFSFSQEFWCRFCSKEVKQKDSTQGADRLEQHSQNCSFRKLLRSQKLSTEVLVLALPHSCAAPERGECWKHTETHRGLWESLQTTPR